MIKKIRTIMLSLLMVVSVAAPAVATTSVFAANGGLGLDCDGINDCVSDGVNKTTDKPATGVKDTVFSIVQTVINVLSWIIGVIAVIMIIIGGLKYITSGGDSGNVSGAKNTILYAIIGLVIVALAQVIVRFVLDTANI